MRRRSNRIFFVPTALALAAGLAACAGPEPADGEVAVEIRGTDPARTASEAAAEGMVDYGEYRVAVAGEGETVESLAARVGVSGTALAAYNGVQPGTELRAGDELVLPPGAAAADAAPPPAEEDFEVAALPGAGAPAAGPAGTEVTPLPPAAGLDPVEVEPGEVEPMPAEPVPDPAAPGEPAADGTAPGGTPPLPGTAPETTPEPAPASGRDWSPDLAAAAIERADAPAGTADEGDLPPPPSAGDPLPPEPSDPRALASPDLGRYQTPAGLPTPFQLTRPVEGPVAIPYDVGSGPQRNEGVDFAAPAGAPVVAAEDGEVALVSESLGGLGTIVLIRHPNDLMTVYGRLGEVQVEKGDYLERGQQFAIVADAPAGTEPRMHFEVRSGADSMDPMEML